MLNLTAPIVPGSSAAGVQLGQSVDRLLAQRQPDRQEQLAGAVRLEFGPVHLWVEGGRVQQIGVHSGYQGTLAGAIGIGSTIAEVEMRFGAVEEDEEDNLVVRMSPGWCFETEQWQRNGGPRDNSSARITGIYVFGESANTGGPVSPGSSA